MKTITKYKADDGSEWDSAEKCVAREQMIVGVEKAMAVLKPHPTNLNWDGYVQHDQETLLECKRSLFKISNQKGVLKWWIDKQKVEHGKTEKDLIEDCHPSYFLRMLDGGNRPICSGYSRLAAIDENLREWNQPYFALNPGTGICRCVG